MNSIWVKNNLTYGRILFVLLVFLLPAGPLGAARYYVDDDTGLDANPGTFLSPFRSVRKAAGTMMTQQTGATCFIFPGIYRERIVIASNKSGAFMLFTRLSNLSPVLAGDMSTNNGITLTNVRKVLIRGLTLKSFRSNGIRLAGYSISNTVMSNTVYSNGLYGVSIMSAGSNRVSRNILYGLNQNAGVYLYSADFNLVSSNIVFNNRGQNGSGLRLDGTSSRNEILGNSFFSNRNGISNLSLLARANRFRDNALFGNLKIGLLLSDAGDNIVRSNRIYRNGNRGVYISGTSVNNYLAGNDIYSNSSWGLGIFGGNANRNLVFSNHLWANTSAGIESSYGRRNEYRGNTIRLHGTTGIYLSTLAHSNVITGNHIFSNTQNGIRMVPGGGGPQWSRIEDNNIHGPGQDIGISTWASGNSFIRNNRIHHHENDGIYLYIGFYDYIAHNLIYSNSVWGILMNNGCTSISVCSNTIYGGTCGWGVGAWAGWNIKLYRNLIYDIATNSIVIFGDSTNCSIVNNTVFRTRYGDAILWTNSAWGNMHNNIVLSNNGFGIRQATTNQPGTGPLRAAAYNLFYGNASGVYTGTNIRLHNNLAADPLLLADSLFTLAFSNSPAFDAGTNIPGLSDVFKGPAPDIGWKELEIYFPVTVVTQKAVDNLSALLLAPNPLRLDPDAGRDSITFFNITPRFEIRVYSLAGGEVAVVRGKASDARFEWQVKDRKGRYLKPGVYFCSIDDLNGRKKVLKLVVKQ